MYDLQLTLNFSQHPTLGCYCYCCCFSTTIPGPPTFGFNTDLHSLHVLNIAVYVCSHRVEDTAHFFLDCPLNVQRLALRNTVTKFRHFRLEAYGDDNLNCETNVDVLLAGHEFIKNPEIF